MDELNDVTVIILTRSRHSKLKKVLPYWSKISIQVLIIDESINDFKLEKKFTNIKYINLRAPIKERLIFATKMLKTKYAIMISDDELLIPSALIKMRDELENNSALSCVGGVTLSIWKYGFRTCGYWAYESTFSLNLDDEKLTNRYKKLFDTKEAIPKLSFMWYNLFKSEVLKDILRVTGTITAQVSEFSSLIIAPASGKIKYLNEIYWIRNWNHPPVSTPQVNRLEDILSVFNSDQMNMIKLQETFMRYGNESEFQTAFQLVSNIIEFDYHKLLARNQKANKYAELIPNKLSRYLIFFIKWFFQRKSVPDDFETVLNRMSEKGVKFTYSEIESAVKIVNRI